MSTGASISVYLVFESKKLSTNAIFVYMIVQVKKEFFSFLRPLYVSYLIVFNLES